MYMPLTILKFNWQLRKALAMAICYCEKFRTANLLAVRQGLISFVRSFGNLTDGRYKTKNFDR